MGERERQERLAALRVERVRAARLLLLAPLAFAPLLVVAAKGLLGVDLQAAPAARAWLVANLVFGAAFLAARLLLTRALASRPWASRLGRLLAGQTLADAERELEASSPEVLGTAAVRHRPVRPGTVSGAGRTPPGASRRPSPSPG